VFLKFTLVVLIEFGFSTIKSTFLPKFTESPTAKSSTIRMLISVAGSLLILCFVFEFFIFFGLIL